MVTTTLVVLIVAGALALGSMILVAVLAWRAIVAAERMAHVVPPVRVKGPPALLATEEREPRVQPEPEADPMSPDEMRELEGKLAMGVQKWLS